MADKVDVPPVDMDPCSKLPKLSNGSVEGFHTWVKSLILEYKQCSIKQEHLRDAITEHNKKPA